MLFYDDIFFSRVYKISDRVNDSAFNVVSNADWLPAVFIYATRLRDSFKLRLSSKALSAPKAFNTFVISFKILAPVFFHSLKFWHIKYAPEMCPQKCNSHWYWGKISVCRSLSRYPSMLRCQSRLVLIISLSFSVANICSFFDRDCWVWKDFKCLQIFAK